MTEIATPSQASKHRSSWIWFLAVGAILLAVLLAAAPWIVAHSGLRDRAINSILASPSVTASSDSASFGWFSPLSVHGLHLNSTNNHVDVRVEVITVERSPWQLWSSTPDLGTIKVEKPHVLLELPLHVQFQGRSDRVPGFHARRPRAVCPPVCCRGPGSGDRGANAARAVRSHPAVGPHRQAPHFQRSSARRGLPARLRGESPGDLRRCIVGRLCSAIRYHLTGELGGRPVSTEPLAPACSPSMTDN